ncbi:MAG: ABC transporter ATP-binding protein [Myxococcales bacterium]|nr:ABC transporter ATP-binding protein [Myxococcales bacterium]
MFRFSRRALWLVWQTSRPLTVTLGVLTLIAGVLPAGIAYVGQLIVDAVVSGIAQREATGSALTGEVLRWVAVEAGLVVAMAAIQRGLGACQSLLRAQLGHRVNVMILDKALTLDLVHFEDSEFYDKLTRARREASSRPLSLVMRTFGLVQNGISLSSYAVLLWQLSPWAVLVLVGAGLPSFIAEAKFSGDAFRLFRWRSPETRKQAYLETVLAREDYAKEVKLFGLGPRLLERYREIFDSLYGEDRALTLRRAVWGFALGLVGTAAFYGAYAWIGVEAVAGAITLGQMTMYLLVFKQGQSSVSAILSAIGGMYEDNLYLSNLYEYLEQEVPSRGGEARSGPRPGDGVRFEGVSFTYPGAEQPAVREVSFHLRPGQALALVGENGSGKTTLIKLLTRLYLPTEGRILLDGRDIREWDEQVLRQRVGVIFQDFARYQLPVGENVGAGDVEAFDDEARWEAAAERGMAAPFIERMPARYHTQLGRWFKDGRELSGGQWQKVALSRAFMRSGADVLVLDEPTAAMDAEAEAQVFEHVRGLSRDRMAVLISHRFSTVRMADHIVVLDQGRVVEQGSHAELVDAGGRYARLFELQAAGYR